VILRKKKEGYQLGLATLINASASTAAMIGLDGSGWIPTSTSKLLFLRSGLLLCFLWQIVAVIGQLKTIAIFQLKFTKKKKKLPFFRYMKLCDIKLELGE
jgi:hypothetical protein